MAISVRAESDPDKPLGHARLVVAGLGKMPADTGFMIRREGYERGNLGPRGWQVSEAQLKPLAARQQGDDAILSVGPEVVRHMEAGPIMFVWPAARVDTVLFWPDDIDVFDGELPRDEPEPAPAPAVLQQPRPTPAPAPQPAPVVVPTPAPPPPAPPKTDSDRRSDDGGGSNKAIAIIFVLLVIGAAAGAGWYFLYGPGAKQEQAAAPTPPTPAPQPTPQPQPTPTPPQPPALAWPDGTDSLTLQELVAKAPNVQGVFDAALRRQAAGKHDDALVLLEEAAEKGHAPALTALARLYDPVGFEAGKPFRSPDPRAAARYYRDAVQKGDAPAEARRAALKTWLEGQAASNPSAAAALKEFWP